MEKQRIKVDVKEQRQKKVENLIIEIFNGIGFLCLAGFSTLGIFVMTYDKDNIFISLFFSVIWMIIFFAMKDVKRM